METSLLLPVVLCLIGLAYSIYLSREHRKERAELMNRIQSKSLSEYIQVQETVKDMKVQRKQKEVEEPVDPVIPIAELENDPVAMQQFLDVISKN